MTPDRPWPRIYSTTKAFRNSLTQAEREEIYLEYRLFWLGRERGNTHPAPDHALQGVHWNGKAGGR